MCFVIRTAHYAPHKIVLEFGEAKVRRRICINFEPFSRTKSVLCEDTLVFVKPSSNILSIPLAFTIVGITTGESTCVGVKLNVDFSITNIITLVINGDKRLNISQTRTNVCLKRQSLADRHIRFGHIYLARICKLASGIAINLKCLASIERIISENTLVFIKPSSNALSIPFAFTIVGIATGESTCVGVELNVNLTITNIITLTIHGDELLDVERTASHANLVECASLLRQTLANVLALVADYVGRFDTETYCGAVETPRYFAFSGDFDT